MYIDVLVVSSDGKQSIEQHEVADNWFEMPEEPKTLEDRLLALETENTELKAVIDTILTGGTTT